MQPTNSDNQAPDPLASSTPSAFDAGASPDPTAPPAPVSAAMSDALAATAAASAVASDVPAPVVPPNPLEPASAPSPIFGPTPPSEALANDPLANNSTAPAATPTTEQSINSSVEAIVSDAPAEITSLPPVSEPSPTPAVPSEPAVASDPDPAPTTPVSDDDLLSMKQDALKQLSPLVDHLDQGPEEKFKTTMMMLQATDNQDLVKEAYEYANQIADEKVRAQALLDVVNEINYFTHQKSQPSQPDVF